MRTRGVIALVVLVIAAGCSSPFAPQSPTSGEPSVTGETTDRRPETRTGAVTSSTPATAARAPSTSQPSTTTDSPPIPSTTTTLPSTATDDTYSGDETSVSTTSRGSTPAGTRGTPTSVVTTAPSDTDTLPSNKSRSPDIAVRNGTLPVNQNRVFVRVQSILGTDVEPPNAIVVRDEGVNLTAGAQGTVQQSEFWSILGVTYREPSQSIPLQENGFTTSLGNIVLSLDDTTNESRAVWVLAHEYVHYIQFKQRQIIQLTRSLPNRTTDSRFVIRSIQEGAAVVGTDAFVERYHEDALPNSALYQRLQRAYSAGSLQQFYNARYIEGAEYVAAKASPNTVEQVYRNPPRTSEQVIHELAPGSEPRRPLAITARLNGSAFSTVGRDTMSEAFIWTALRNSLNESVAMRAAAGWGNDRRLTVRAGDAVGYAWAIRWDDAENASEFVATFRASREGQTTGDKSEVRLTTVSDQTVVVLAGDPPFVDVVTVNGTTDAVAVSVGSTNSS